MCEQIATLGFQHPAPCGIGYREAPCRRQGGAEHMRHNDPQRAGMRQQQQVPPGIRMQRGLPGTHDPPGKFLDAFRTGYPHTDRILPPSGQLTRKLLLNLPGAQSLPLAVMHLPEIIHDLAGNPRLDRPLHGRHAASAERGCDNEVDTFGELRPHGIHIGTSGSRQPGLGVAAIAHASQQFAMAQHVDACLHIHLSRGFFAGGKYANVCPSCPREAPMQDFDPTDPNPSRPDAEAAMQHVRDLLIHIGEDPEREGLQETPKRVIAAFEEYFSGYNEDPREHLEKTFEEVEGYDEMVLVSDIDVHSHCEHHMAPFVGKAHVAYIPNGRVVGLSKLARVVDVYARRLQVQEKLTMQIAQVIEEVLQPKGVAVIIQCRHFCMCHRGVRKPYAWTTTSKLSGAFRNNPSSRLELFKLISMDKD